MDDLTPLLTARAKRDADALFDAVPRIKKRSAAPLLSELLLEDWHESHEDIVFELGLIGDPCAIVAISQAVLIPFESLGGEWGNLHEFQRKCAYALARISTPESREALEVLAKHPDPHIQAYGAEGLESWPMPYKGAEYV